MTTVVAFDDEKVNRLLKKLTEKVAAVSDKKRSFVELLSANVLADIIDHFETERGPDGPWKQWSPGYRKWRMSGVSKANLSKGRGFIPKILHLTGRLKQGWQPANVRTSPAGVLWFNPVPYGKKHDEGSDGMPERKFAWLSSKAIKKIESETAKFILDFRT